jgi:hypothetical protein
MSKNLSITRRAAEDVIPVALEVWIHQNIFHHILRLLLLLLLIPAMLTLPLLLVPMPLLLLLLLLLMMGSCPMAWLSCKHIRRVIHL